MSIKERLSEDEKRICYFLKEIGVGIHSVSPSNDLDCYDFYELSDFLKETVPILEHYELIVLNKITPNTDGYAEDVFFKSYLRLIKEGNKDDAYKLAELCNSTQINLLTEEKINKNNIGLINVIGPDASFGQDFCSCIFLDIEITQKLVDFVKIDIEPNFEEEPDFNNIGLNKVRFEKEKSILIISGETCPIRKFSQQYYLLEAIFTDPEKEWQFSELGEMLDFEEKYEWKRLHNIALAIKAKVASNSRVRDFFITTTQSVKINHKILKKEVFGLDDF